MRRATLILIGLLLAMLPTQAGGREPVPVGPEFQVNEATTYAWTAPDVALTPNGDFVVVWTASDADFSGIFGRAFEWDGTPRTGDSPVNTNALGSQFGASIAMEPEGRFVVAWTHDSDGSGGSYDRYPVARLFNPDATPAGPEILVDDASFSLSVTDVAMHQDGSFVVAWTRRTGNRARRFNETGDPASAVIDVDGASYSPRSPRIALQPGGRFIVVWDDDDSYDYYYLGGVSGRAFEADGTPRDVPFEISPHIDFHRLPAAASDHAGNFVVAWTAEDCGYKCTLFTLEPADIEFRPFSHTTTPLAPAARVNTTPGHPDQRHTDARTVMNSHGDFVVVWRARDLHPANDWHVRARAFDRTATALGTEISAGSVGDITESTMDWPVTSAAMNDTGQTVVVWMTSDGSDRRVLGQRFCLDVPYALAASDGSGGSLRVLDLETAAARSQLALDTGEALVDDISPVSSPHGRLTLLATNGAAGARLRVVEIGSGLVQHDLRLGTGESFQTGIGPLFTPDSELVIVATTDGAAGTVHLRVVQVATGGVVHHLVFGPGEILVSGVDLESAPDSSMAFLATSVTASRSARLRMVNLATGNVDGLHTTPIGLDLVKDVDVVLTPDGNLLLLPTSDWDRVRLVVLDTATGLVDAYFGTPSGERLHTGVGVAVTPDSQYALLPTAGNPPHLRVIDLEAATLLDNLLLRHTDFLVENVGLVLTPDGERAVLATDDPAYQSARLRVFEIAGGTIETEVTVGVGQQLQAGVGPVVTPSGEQALLASFNDLPRLSFLEIATGILGTPLDLPSSEWLAPGVPLLVNPESDRVAWVTNDVPAVGGHVRIVDLTTGTVAHQVDLGVNQLVETGVGAVSTQCGFTLLVPSEGAPAGQLRVIDVATGSVAGDVPLAAGESIHVGVAPVVPPSVVLADCNGNRIPDAEDISAGSSADCNTNDFPDECEPDCNLNGFPDDCDIAGGFSQDCDASDIPDECEADCNTNGFHDSCDIALGTSFDCNGDGIPDECDADCNTNTIPDVCDLFDGTSGDCNVDGVPDECQPELDLDGDGVPECSDNCPGLFNDQTDGDSDLQGDDCDCRFDDGTAWVPPGPTLDLRLEQAGSDTILTWSGPDAAAHGSTLGVAYDVIRSVNPFNFVSQGTCVESDSPDEQSVDSTDPAAYAPFFYLTRATNNCPIGNGPVGERSNGTPRTARSCP